MTSVTIIMEGGGDSASGRAAIRQGMDRFLGAPKQRARDRRVRWKLAAWGSRGRAYDRFRAAVRDHEADVVVLLVDAEGPVAKPPLQHLTDRDGWTLDFAAPDTVHLMVQSMETWIIADIATLKTYYGNGFRSNPLPTSNLESLDRAAVSNALRSATRDTTKGAYQKIRDGAKLLERVDPEVVADACPGCAALFGALHELLD